MRILFLCLEKSNAHGWAKFCRQLSNTLTKQQDNIVVNGTNIFKTDKSDTFVRVRLKSNDRHDSKYFTLIRDILANLGYFRQPDIIIAGDEYTIPVSYLAARMFGKRLILNIHGTYAIKGLKGKRRKLFIAAYKYAEKICSVSNYTRSRLIQILPELSNKISVIPLSVLTKPMNDMPKQNKQEHHFVIVGEVKARKGVKNAVQAIRMLRERGNKVNLKIIGKVNRSSNYVDELIQFIDQYSLQHYVEFCGFLSSEHKDRLVATAISNLLPSQNVGDAFEGFGFVHLEAGYLAVPSIGSLDCGNEDAIVDSVSGYLVDQNDLNGLVDRMELLHKDKNLRNTMGLSAQENCQAWTWRDIGESYQQLLNR